MGEPFIVIKDLEYRYQGTDGEVTALAGINLTVPRGEFLAVVGPNGSGKSTLARHLNGLLLPTAGSVTVAGYDTRQTEDIWTIRRKVGMVFQNPDNQLVAAIVEDELAFGPENLGISPDEIRRRVDQCIAGFRLQELRDRPPHLLSGGQKQRVAIAAVLTMGTDCVVLDEPTAMLDPQGRGEVLQTLRELHQQGQTVMLVTHDMSEVAYAQRVAVLNRGKLFFTGTPQELFQQPDLQHLGLELPPGIDLGRRLREKGFDLPGELPRAGDWVDYLCSLLK